LRPRRLSLLNFPGLVKISHAVASAAILIALALLLIPAPEGVDPSVLRAGGVVALAIGLWSTGVVPEYMTAILFFFAAVILGIAPPDVVFSGFHSGAVWLVFGGLVFGAGVLQTGLGERTARLMLAHFPKSYFGVLAGVTLVGVALSFLMPSSMGRVMLLVPIILSLAEQLGFEKGSRGYVGVVLAAGLGTMVPAFAILPANVPNMGLIGSAESIYGITFIYGAYLLLNFAVVGIGSAIAIPVLLAVLFPDRPRPADIASEAKPWSGGERRLLIILLGALGLWITDFAHGISPAWVALGAAVLCLLPRFGVVPATILSKGINFGPWLFVAGVIGMGAVANHAGLGDAVGAALLSVLNLGPGDGATNFAAIFGIGLVVGTVTTLPASPAIMTPLAQTIADATGWPLVSVLMMQVPTWIFFPFSYQAPPLVVTIALGGLRIGQVMRFLAAHLMVGALIILPLYYLWGRWLGYYP